MSDQREPSRKPLDLAAMRQELSRKKGKEHWRSLNELAGSEEFEEAVRREFPRQAQLLGDLNRRDFLKVLGASLALAGLTSCAPNTGNEILPYVDPPLEEVPGKFIYYASTMIQDGVGKGVLLKTTLGRPIKVEGNPLHPESLGSTDVFMQASLLELYDPDRAQQILNQGATKTWNDFAKAAPGLAGGNLRILSSPVTSPSLTDQIQALLKQNTSAKWYQYSPITRSNSYNGAMAAFGQPLEPVYDFTKAEVVLSLDSDFLFVEPGHVRYAHDFALKHQPVSPYGVMNRLYVVESSMTITGGNADHRLPVKPSEVEAFARAVANRLGLGVNAPASFPGQSWLDPLVADLKRAGAGAVVLAGERQPAAVHALAHAMNQALGAIGTTVNYIPSITTATSDSFTALSNLTDELNGGGVDTLVIFDANPVYSAPVDLNFAQAMKKAKNIVYMGAYKDETAELATWFIPETHYMEMWGDAKAYDGTVSIVQPVILPLNGGKSPYELVATLAGQGDAKGYDLVRAYWKGQMTGGDFESSWTDMLSKGFFANSAAKPANVGTIDLSGIGPEPAAVPADTLEIVFEPDYTIWDGRFSNNAWMQELPKPIAKLTWDNAAYMSPVTMAKLNLDTGLGAGIDLVQLADRDVVTLQLGGKTVEATAYEIYGQADNVVVVSLGYGRTAGGNTLEGLGFNANAIRPIGTPWFASGVTIDKTGRTYPLAYTREHWTMENRDLIRTATLPEYQKNPAFAQAIEGRPPTLYGEYVYEGYAWGMAVNLNTCIGCNACVIACQAENNIPTVGKDQVIASREMHWLRIDRYFAGTLADPKFISFQPVPCMHCEKAPCEPVCPVEATSHSSEGINEMTYNRCVGTRYCSNNCPYKVRRFNFFKFSDLTTPSLKPMRNPEVTIRMRGVMEKCTYCLQRITAARIQAQVENRTIADGEVETACQQACPTKAITFGNINDTSSQVRKQKETPLNYALLGDLGTVPRTTYLAKVKNPNPNIVEA